MRLTLQQENARTLAALLGVEEEEAAARLQLRIGVTFEPSVGPDRAVARHVIALLNRTVAWAGSPDGTSFAAEVVIGECSPQTTAPAVFVDGRSGDIAIRTGSRDGCHSLESLPPVLYIVVACYVAAAAVAAALGPSFPLCSVEPILLKWSELYGDLTALTARVDIGEAFLAGAGAVGNGFIYALRYLNVRGTLHIVDPKRVNSGGLNRCLLVDEDDVGKPKASRLCDKAQGTFSNLHLVPHDTTLSDVRKARGASFLIDRLIVAVDSRPARRSLQTELPRMVFDASTTDVREVVLHFNRQPTELACLSCVYPQNERERKHEENVADALGITVEEVRSGLCTRATAEKIRGVYQDVSVEDLIGRAFDTVYKEFCSVGKLKADGGQQVLAPFSFVSVLAGAQLAIEFVFRLAGSNADRFNYWRLSPWRSPVVLLRQHRPRDPQCEFCGNPVIRRQLDLLFQNPAR